MGRVMPGAVVEELLQLLTAAPAPEEKCPFGRRNYHSGSAFTSCHLG
jgi:hypothetical protein